MTHHTPSPDTTIPTIPIEELSAYQDRPYTGTRIVAERRTGAELHAGDVVNWDGRWNNGWWAVLDVTTNPVTNTTYAYIGNPVVNNDNVLTIQGGRGIWLRHDCHVDVESARAAGFTGTVEGYRALSTPTAREVLDYHHPMPWYQECTRHPEPPAGTPEYIVAAWEAAHFPVGEDTRTCEQNRAADRCSACTRDDADDVEVASVVWPCATAIRAARILGLHLDSRGATR